jgi:hypothetical protein
MLTKLHPIAGVIGFVTILTFWLSTVTSELFGSTAAIAAVKETIPWGFLVLVPALAIAGASGQVVPAPAAQSLSPLSTTPKHLSMVGCPTRATSL